MSASAQAPSPSARVPLRDVVVLIVSDNDTEVAILKQYLRDLRCGAMLIDRTARDGLDTLARGEVDVLIARDRLPDADAFALLQAIRLKARKAKAPAARVVYVVDRRKAAIEVVAQADPDAILAWPMSLNDFRDRVEGVVLRQRRLLNEIDPSSAPA